MPFFCISITLTSSVMLRSYSTSLSVYTHDSPSSCAIVFVVDVDISGQRGLVLRGYTATSWFGVRLTLNGSQRMHYFKNTVGVYREADFVNPHISADKA